MMGPLYAPVLLYPLIAVAWLIISILAACAWRQPRRILQLIVLTWGVRIVLMVLLKIYSERAGLGGFYPGDIDARVYHAYATNLALSGTAGTTMFTFYVNVVAALYGVFGIDVTSAQLINLGLSVVCLPIIVQLAREIRGPNAGFSAGLLWAFLPSGALWSISLLKDIWIIVGLLLAAVFVVKSARRMPTAGAILVGAPGILLVSLMRPPFVFVILAGFVIVTVMRSRARLLPMLATVGISTAILLMVATQIGNGRAWMELTRAVTASGIESLAYNASLGSTNLPVVESVPSFARWIVQLPYSIFAPFPWQWGLMGSGLGRLSGLEMVALYLMYYVLWGHRRELWANHSSRALLILAGMVFIAVSFSIPNVGTIYRYRWPAVVLLLPVLPLDGVLSRRPKVQGRRASGGVVPELGSAA